MIAVKYIFFALIAIFTNLLFQHFCLMFYAGAYSLYFAMLLGTTTGLIIKYFLDKNFIFYYTPENNKDEGYKILLYSFTGIATTIIFWSFELSFNYLIDSAYAKYVGAVIGLIIGYFLKYTLDLEYTFKEKQ